jgi:hypothetical protein
VKPDAKVWLSNIHDETLIAQLEERAMRVSRGSRPPSDCDVVFVGVESTAQIDRIERALDALAERGAIWVVHPKGPSGVADTAIFAKAKTLGLTYTKVARVSNTHTAEKLVRSHTRRPMMAACARRHFYGVTILGAASLKV